MDVEAVWFSCVQVRLCCRMTADGLVIRFLTFALYLELVSLIEDAVCQRFDRSLCWAVILVEAWICC